MLIPGKRGLGWLGKNWDKTSKINLQPVVPRTEHNGERQCRTTDAHPVVWKNVRPNEYGLP